MEQELTMQVMILLMIGLMVCPSQESADDGNTDPPVDRVRWLALKLAPTLEEKPDMLVLELIALFHDMADGKTPPLLDGWNVLTFSQIYRNLIPLFNSQPLPIPPFRIPTPHPNPNRPDPKSNPLYLLLYRNENESRGNIDRMAYDVSRIAYCTRR